MKSQWRTMFSIAASLIFTCCFPLSVMAENEAKIQATTQKTTTNATANRQCGEEKRVTEGHKSIVERLKPGEELHGALKRIASENHLKAGVVVSAVGSLTEASLRLAGASDSTILKGPLEIVSITGTLSEDGMHVHLSVSDSAGKTTGGHMTSGCKVFTTVELVILDLSGEWSFERKIDEQSTYLELYPRRREVPK